MLTSTLRTVGGSVMMAIPKAILDVLGLGANDRVALHIDALLAECDANADPTDEDRGWDALEPVGREIL